MKIQWYQYEILNNTFSNFSTLKFITVRLCLEFCQYFGHILGGKFEG